MTTPIRFEQDLPALVADTYLAGAPDYRDELVQQLADTSQRPAWTIPGRWLPMDLVTERVTSPPLPWRSLAIVAMLALLIAGALVAYIGSQPHLPAPFGPAANGVIPYAVDGDLFAGDPATGLSRTVLTGPTFDLEPAYSRDGTRLAFLRREEPANPDSAVRIFVIDAPGAAPQAVTGVIRPDWWDWGTGSSLVVVDHSSDLSGFSVYDAAQPTLAPIHLATRYFIDVPTFRPPIGHEIMFRGQDGAKVGIFAMNADGSNMHPLIAPATTLNPTYTLREPRYSPDGDQIAYMQWDDVSQEMHLWLMDADGSNKRQVDHDPAIGFVGWPVWSNDGTRIAVQRARTVASAPNGSRPYGIISVRDGSVVETGPVLPEGGGRIEWAPDDTSLLVLPNGDHTDQILLDPAGGPARVLPWTSDSYPTWQRTSP